ncbi:zinc finger protein 106-like isoform X1 [Polypterus senegalus]|nr:zinc finger protein 106-like isoform X1 [Polypterus senegalus]
MGKEMKCILCETVYSSKQEIEEHMRSMLHHRELENLKGRDCDHECRVCRVTVVGLTAYASHISSELHKEKVELQEREGIAVGEKYVEREYFDKELVKLIEKRRHELRKEEELRRRNAGQEAKNLQNRPAERFNYNQTRRADFHQIQPRDWAWERNSYPSDHQGNRPHSSFSHNTKTHNGGSRSSSRWNQDGASSNWKFQNSDCYGHWHTNSKQSSWSNGRNSGWPQKGSGNLHSWISSDVSGTWGSDNWNYSGFPHQREHTKKNTNYQRGQYSWGWRDGCQGPNQENESDFFDFTHDNIPNAASFHFSSNGKSNVRSSSNTTRDKMHRWAPYPPAKAQETSVEVNHSKKNDEFCASTQTPPLPSDSSLKRDSSDLRQTPSAAACEEPSVNLDCNAFPLSNVYEQKSPHKQQISSSKNEISTKVQASQSPFMKDLQSKDTSNKANSEWEKSSNFNFKERILSLKAVNQEANQGNFNIQSTLNYKSLLNGSQDQDNSLKEMLLKAKEILSSGKVRNILAAPSVEVPATASTPLPPETSIDNTTETSIYATKNKNEEIFTDSLKESLITNNKIPGMHFVFSPECANSKAVSPSPFVPSLSSATTNEAPENSGISDMTSLEDKNSEMRNTNASSESSIQELDHVADRDFQQAASLHPVGPIVSDLNKLELPASLRRDLTRHITSKNKAGTHEPNLNIARRIRNISGHRKSESEKESVLKPTLRQLISSSGARRNVDWDQVYQQVSRKKQEQGKGLPRFGIEMVPPVQQDPNDLCSEEPELELSSLEGFQWEGISDTAPASSRKRSLSESSMATDRAGSIYNLFSDRQTSDHKNDVHSENAPTRSPVQLTERESSSPGLQDLPFIKKELNNMPAEQYQPGQVSAVEEDRNNATQGQDSMEGDSSCTSGAEQNDNQGLGKKRRAGTDAPTPEIPNLEITSKRRKIKLKKERSQVEQLLSISLKEEELTKSLEGVDSNLLQARSALQHAYIEVQRLLMLKQQMTVEMGTLRSKRIAVLQGLQENYDGPEPFLECRNQLDAPLATTLPSMFLSPTIMDTIPTSTEHLQQNPCASLLSPGATPSSLCSDISGAASTSQQRYFKQEPGIESNSNLQNTAEVLSAVSLPVKDSPEVKISVYPKIVHTMSLAGNEVESLALNLDWNKRSPVSTSPGWGKPKDNVEKMQDIPLPVNTSPFANQEKNNIQQKKDLKDLPRKNSDLQLVHTEFPLTIESKSGKRIKKLKKKKDLHKANERQNNSDTEQDSDISRPKRKTKGKKNVKDSKVSTSSCFAQLQEEPKVTPGSEIEQQGSSDSDSSLEMIELPPAKLEVVDLNSSGSGEDNPNSTLNSNKASISASDSRDENQKLGCDEVSSTSELMTPSVGLTKAVETQSSVSSAKGSKNSSEVSSEPGDEDEPTEGSFEGHQGAVNAMQIHSGLLYTCSGDKTARVFNLITRKCIAVFEGHSSKVNCLCVVQISQRPVQLYTGSSDHTVRCYNVKTKKFRDEFCLLDRVLCLHSRWRMLFAGLANGTVVAFNLKSNKQMDVFECHAPRAVSCISSAQEGARKLLLVGSYDSTISVRDANSGLLLRTLEGHTKTVLCMKVVNDLVFSGSSDQSVHAHNIHTGELVRIYKGHSHAVTVVNVLGKVMVTACLDKLVRVYELQSHDRLQIYGGHNDMVMCMTVHKSMIYTGCYDGSIQAVKLNLMQNYRCWWHGCSFIFGVVQHLIHHLLTDHISPNFQMLKCRWKNCDGFFTSKNWSKQDVPKHMKKHAEEESKVDP